MDNKNTNLDQDKKKAEEFQQGARKRERDVCKVCV